MQLYWRIMEELFYLGEVINIVDPNIRREFQKWTKKHNVDKIWLIYLRHDKTTEN